MTYFISLFDISFVPEPKVPYPQIFLRIHASAADAPSVNPNGMNTLLANSMSTFFINCKPTIVNGPRSLPRYLAGFIILVS